jgi:hypothetical protein
MYGFPGCGGPGPCRRKDARTARPDTCRRRTISPYDDQRPTGLSPSARTAASGHRPPALNSGPCTNSGRTRCARGELNSRLSRPSPSDLVRSRGGLRTESASVATGADLRSGPVRLLPDGSVTKSVTSSATTNGCLSSRRCRRPVVRARPRRATSSKRARASPRSSWSSSRSASWPASSRCSTCRDERRGRAPARSAATPDLGRPPIEGIDPCSCGAKASLHLATRDPGCRCAPRPRRAVKRPPTHSARHVIGLRRPV